MTLIDRYSEKFNIQALTEWVEPVCNVTPNSMGLLLHEIKVSERTHWFDGLRCAELFVRSLSETMQYNHYLHRRLERQEAEALDRIHECRISLKAMDQESDNPHVQIAVKRIERNIEAQEDKIAQAVYNRQSTEAILRDTAMLLTTAITERERIIAENPAATAMSYLEIQQQITPEVVVARQAKYFAGRTTSLPEAAGIVLIDTPPDDRQRLMTQVIALQSGVDSTVMFAQLQARLAEVHPADRAAALTKMIDAIN